MSLSVGIVGLPNVGKSTLFRALTQKEVEVANYPFATIDPNVGIVKVPDDRLDKLAELFHSEQKIPAIVEFVDIAGLVKNAHKGEGLGNQFLANIREVGAVCHVVRAFRDGDIHHVAQRVDPLEDLKTIEMELLLKDMETLERRLGSLEKDVKAGKKEAAAQKEALVNLQEWFDQGRSAREFLQEYPDLESALRDLQLLTAKPQIAAVSANSEDEVPADFREKLEKQGIPFLVMNMREELELSTLSREEADELGLVSNLPRLLRLAYQALDLITFFTAGEKESRAWTIRAGTRAPEAAGVIHTDFHDKFIRAEVIPWNVLVTSGGYKGAYAAGLVRTEGKEYIVRDGDVLEIRHG